MVIVCSNSISDSKVDPSRTAHDPPTKCLRSLESARTMNCSWAHLRVIKAIVINSDAKCNTRWYHWRSLGLLRNLSTYRCIPLHHGRGLRFRMFTIARKYLSLAWCPWGVQYHTESIRCYDTRCQFKKWGQKRLSFTCYCCLAVCFLKFVSGCWRFVPWMCANWWGNDESTLTTSQ